MHGFCVVLDMQSLDSVSGNWYWPVQLVRQVFNLGFNLDQKVSVVNGIILIAQRCW